MTHTNTDRTEMADMLTEAQERLDEALEILNYVADNGPRGSYWRNYVISAIEIARGESSWLSNDPDIDDWIIDLAMEEEKF